MWGTSTISDLSLQAAVKAKAHEKQPIRILNWDTITIPFLGTYLPEGWKLVDQRFVDSTGKGRKYEPAMTQADFKTWVESVQAADEHAGFAILEQGQFQIYVGYYTCDSCPVEPSEDLEFSPGDVEFEWCGSCEEPKAVNEDCWQCGWPSTGEDDSGYTGPHSIGQTVHTLAENIQALVMDNPDIRPFDIVEVEIIDIDEFGLWVVLGGDIFGAAVATIQDSDVLNEYNPASDPAQASMSL